MGKLTAPRPLSVEDKVDEFDCGEIGLNIWLQKQALKNEKSGASRTFVISADGQVIGFYALATGAVDRISAPKSVSRNMPQPIPVLVLGRLGLDKSHQNNRLGSHLLKDALLRTYQISESVGVPALVVHAISEKAKSFYVKYGFLESPLSPMTLFLPIAQILHLSTRHGNLDQQPT